MRTLSLRQLLETVQQASELCEKNGLSTDMVLVHCDVSLMTKSLEVSLEVADKTIWITSGDYASAKDFVESE